MHIIAWLLNLAEVVVHLDFEYIIFSLWNTIVHTFFLLIPEGVTVSPLSNYSDSRFQNGRQ